MARPQKNNADYFPHDANMRDDPKIKALRARYGLTGYAIWCILLETLTDADNFTIHWDELTQELTAGDIGIELEKLLEITAYLQKLQLIQIENNQLHTHRHRERMAPILENRERKRQWKQENTAKATAKTPAAEISDGENTQSKVKEIKEKETKVERELPAHAHEQENFQKQKNQTPTPADIYAAIEAHVNTDHGLRELVGWKKQAAYSDKKHGPTTGELTKFIAYYLDRIRASPDPVAYYRDHFAAWLVRATEYNRPKPNAAQYTPPPNAKPYTPPEKRTGETTLAATLPSTVHRPPSTVETTIAQ